MNNEVPEKSRTALEIWGVTRVLKNGKFWLKKWEFSTYKWEIWE